MYAIFGVAVVVLLALVLIGWTLEDRICARLRAEHPDLWESLGSPDRYFDDFGSVRRRALTKLYEQPELMRRCNEDTVHLLRSARLFGRVCLGIAVVALAACLAYIACRL